MTAYPSSEESALNGPNFFDDSFGGYKNKEEVSRNKLQDFFDQDKMDEEIERFESTTTNFLFHFVKKVFPRYLFNYGFI